MPKLLAMLVAITLTGCLPVPATKPAGPINICDGNAHRFRDLEIQLTESSTDGDSAMFKLLVSNKSEGGVFTPISEARIVDNFGNVLQSRIEPRNAIANPGDAISVAISAKKRVPNSIGYRLELEIETGRLENGNVAVVDVTGTLGK